MFSARMMALAVAFVAGWLFSNEVKAPLYDAVSLQVWMGAIALGAVLMALGGR